MITKDSSGANLSQAFITAVSQPLVNFDMRLFSGGSDTGWSVKRAQVDLGAGASEEDQLADFQIGSVYTSQMEAQLNGATGQVVGRDVEVRVGVLVSGSYQYVTIAHMTVVSAREWMGTTTVRCVGVMSALNVLLGVSEGDYTPAQVRDAIQSASGVSVALGSFGSTSTTVSIEEGSTCRQALEQLALRLGGFAAETHDGGIRVAPFSSSTTYALDSDRIRQAPDIALSDFVADGLDVRTPTDTFTFGTGRVRAYDETATSSTSAVIWSNIQGYSYRPGSVMVGIVDPRVTPFDVASVKGAALPTRGISVTYDGGYFGRYSAAGLTADAVDSLVRGSLTQAVDDVATTALDAKSASQIAQNSAASALASANSAQTSADAAQASATAASTAAGNAQRDATAAGTAAANAQRDATKALKDAAAASTAAANAQTSADNAATAASNAATAASNAQTSADNAQASANTANDAANDALNQLSVIEDVSGTLAWISEHGTYTVTTDTTVQDGTVYFEKSGSDYVPVTNPTGNPRQQGWYVLDISDSQSEYIMAHLAVTSAGLWVLPSGVDGQTPETSSGYKVLLSNTGMTVYDGNGTAVANYGGNVIVGQVGAAHTTISPDETTFFDADANEAARISMSDDGALTAHASYSMTTTSSWQTRTESGIVPLPDFSLGNLNLTVSIDGTVALVQNISSLSEPVISFTYDDLCDVTFQATGDSLSWTATMRVRDRTDARQYEVAFGLSWSYIGTAPMFNFGAAENQGGFSFSAGNGNEPNGEGAITLGLGLKASRSAQAVFGKYNKPSQYAQLIVGNGTDDANRSNSFEVTDQGITTRGYVQTGGAVGFDPTARENWLYALGFGNLQSGTYSGTVNVTSSWYGLYYGKATIPITARADTSYKVLTTLRCAGNLVWCSLNSKSTSSFEVFVISPRNSAQSVTIDWMVYG